MGCGSGHGVVRFDNQYLGQFVGFSVLEYAVSNRNEVDGGGIVRCHDVMKKQKGGVL